MLSSPEFLSCFAAKASAFLRPDSHVPQVLGSESTRLKAVDLSETRVPRAPKGFLVM